jgi:simple sugar transport system ATP-binding protein
MLGRKFEETYPKYPARMGETIFSVSGLSDGSKIPDVNLSVRAGEIVGIAGLVGAGKSELCKALFGAEKRAHGTTAIRGTPRRIRSAHEAVRRGLALVPEERRKEGILVDETVVTILGAASLGSFCGPLGVIDFRAERKSARDMIGALGIRTPRAEQKVALLSGGNQQKVAVGSGWWRTRRSIYSTSRPGCGCRATRDIFELIGKLAGQGRGSSTHPANWPRSWGSATGSTSCTTEGSSENSWHPKRPSRNCFFTRPEEDKNGRYGRKHSHERALRLLRVPYRWGRSSRSSSSSSFSG